MRASSCHRVLAITGVALCATAGAALVAIGAAGAPAARNGPVGAATADIAVDAQASAQSRALFSSDASATARVATETKAPASAVATLAAAAPEGTAGASGASQYNRRRRRAPPRFADPAAPQNGDFAFARIMYQSVRYEALGQGWYTDYPDGDTNYMARFDEFTTAAVRFTNTGYPDHVVLTLYDEQLFEYPFVFMSDVGTVGFDALEVERLRDYLLKGGFLWVDDFWGWAAWDQWVDEIGRVLPPSDYPIFDIPTDHPVRRMLYPIDEIPQIPSIQWWRRSGRFTTSERGLESATPHLRGIADESGRIMVLMTHNTDIADGWERENEDFEFFESFSFPAYAVGINIGLYSMSH